VGSVEILVDFQFHYGAIGAGMKRCSTSRLIVFQFHYGAMEALRTWSRRRRCIMTFNSTMVRWKQSADSCLPYRFPAFNSTMVRWKRHGIGNLHLAGDLSIPLWCDGSEPYDLRESHLGIFQFHYGAMEAKMFLYYFNRDTSFNSTMVRWKRCHCARVDTGTWTFNSTMVRWKSMRVMIDVGISLFQFHYGAMEAKLGLSLAKTFNYFQFHYGAMEARHNRPIV